MIQTHLLMNALVCHVSQLPPQLTCFHLYTRHHKVAVALPMAQPSDSRERIRDIYPSCGVHAPSCRPEIFHHDDTSMFHLLPALALEVREVIQLGLDLAFMVCKLWRESFSLAYFQGLRLEV